MNKQIRRFEGFFLKDLVGQAHEGERIKIRELSKSTQALYVEESV